MFLYLIAFTAALLTIFGHNRLRNSLRSFLRTGYNILGGFLSTRRGCSSHPNEFTEQQILEIGEERIIKADEMLVEGPTEIIQNVVKTSDEKPVSHKQSNESFTFDYKTRRYDLSQDAEDRSSYSERDSRHMLVPQDMWNILKKTAVPASERKNAETLFEALLQETLRESIRLADDDIENDSCINKTQIIDEATFEKMMEEQNQKESQNRKDHYQIEYNN